MTTETLQTQDWFFSAPYSYLEDERLDIYDKMVYTVLCAHASAASKTAFPSAKTIAKEGALSRAKVFICLTKLEQYGYISRKKRFKMDFNEETKELKRSKDTNEYTVKTPSTRDGLPPSTHDRLVHTVDHLPSPPDRLVHDVDYPPSPQHGHITDIDFDYDLDNDDDRKNVHDLSVQIYQELIVTYKDLTLLQVCETMKRCIDHSPSDLYKYCRKAVIQDLEDVLKGVPKKVNAGNLKRKKQQSRKPVRKENDPDALFAQYEKQASEHPADDLEAKKRAIEEKLARLRK